MVLYRHRDALPCVNLLFSICFMSDIKRNQGSENPHQLLLCHVKSSLTQVNDKNGGLSNSFLPWLRKEDSSCSWNAATLTGNHKLFKRGQRTTGIAKRVCFTLPGHSPHSSWNIITVQVVINHTVLCNCLQPSAIQVCQVSSLFPHHSVKPVSLHKNCRFDSRFPFFQHRLSLEIYFLQIIMDLSK